MESLLAAIKDWPVVVQGALGSALFAAVLFTGQRITAALTAQAKGVSLARQRSRLLDESVRLRAGLAKTHEEKAYYAALILVRASRYFVRALIWLSLGLIASSFLNVFGIVGYLGCVYYLFGTLNVVGPIDSRERMARLEQVQAALKQIDGTDG